MILSSRICLCVNIVCCVTIVCLCIDSVEDCEFHGARLWCRALKILIQVNLCDMLDVIFNQYSIEINQLTIKVVLTNDFEYGRVWPYDICNIAVYHQLVVKLHLTGIV